ncbi:MAG: hypothetical protein ACLPTZ_06595 [Beijerinckiaceae bacterium]
MPKGRRDYRAEYARRIAHGAAKGISRSQARGHPKPKESSVSSKRPPRRIEDDRLQLALKVLRQEKSLSAAAKAAKIAPERLRHFATERDIIERQGRRWIVRSQLPRRMLLFSDGRVLQVVVGDFDAASKIGRFMSAVGEFLRTNNRAVLSEFEGVSVTDVSGKAHVFETRPNALYRLASAHDQSFEHIYRIVV